MAFPTIRVNSGSGSDTNTSGAGPTTALTGTGASTDVAGTTVTLDANTDLSGVATDGSAVIYVDDTTAGRRRFSAINGTAGSGGATPTVTVVTAFAGSLSGKAWAIGGSRASLGNATSKLLFDNNGGAGDAMPGWIVECASGHTETIAATYDLRRGGDTTSGPITLRGAIGAATVPAITFSNNGNAFVFRGVAQVIQSMELRNSNASKTASVAILSASGSDGRVIGVKIGHSTQKFWKGLVGPYYMRDCEVGYTASHGIDCANAPTTLVTMWVHDCGGSGVVISGGASRTFNALGCLIVSNASHGIDNSSSGGSAQSHWIIGNTFAYNGGDGVRISSSPNGTPFGQLLVANNIFANNSGYGLNFSSASTTSAALDYYHVGIAGNTFYTNTSGATNPATIASGVYYNNNTLNPSFTNRAGHDWSVGSALAGQGVPIGGVTPVGTYSATYSYVDPGAAQRASTGVGGVSRSRVVNN